MHLEDEVIRDRIERIHTERIAGAISRTLSDVEVSVWAVPGDGEPVPPQQAREATYEPTQLPVRWGRAWSTWWFRLDGTVPQVTEGRSLRLEVDLGFKDAWPGNQCEGLLFDAGLTPLKAVNSRNRGLLIRKADGTGRCTPGEEVRFYLEAAANPDMMDDDWTPTERGDHLTAPPEKIYELRSARFVERDETVFALWHDVDVLRGMIERLPEKSVRRAQILWALDDAMDALDLHDVPGTAAAAREILAPVLAAPAASSALTMTAIGHAHIDSAWLWPVRETMRKVARTFSNVDALMDEYPELTFTATSAQQYKWLKEGYPEIFERVRARVAEGRWFPSGGMWVESDVNLPGGEALVRQLTYGTRFFEAEFGMRSRTLWLPDSFGYPAALPQIARQAGMDGFLTQKLSWNRINQLPHSTMWWEGIDGSRILAHFPPVNCYDSEVSAEEIERAENNFCEKGRARGQVLPFGYGDGGGGPVPLMVERARRRADLEGSPRIEMGSPDAFFDQAHAEYGDRAPVHRGELYLEFHRGVYTSQLEMKQGNRRSEHALRELELLWSLVAANGIGAIDQAEVDSLWETVLLLQFHDILPGSSIAWVHRDARADYERVLARCEELTQEAVALLAEAERMSDQSAAAVLSTAPHERTEVVRYGGEQVLVRVPGSSIVSIEAARVEPAAPVTAEQGADGEITLENARVRAVIAADGTFTSVIDREADRELVVPGSRAGELQMFEDVPAYFDAWDIDRHYRSSPRTGRVGAPTRMELVESSPLRAVVEIERMLGESPTIQRIELTADSARLDCTLDVDWFERETLLKVAFPLAITARDHVAQIQFGHVRRPLHENTSWDFAKFETPMHRWVLAEDASGYGAALINDSTYGYDALPLRGENAALGRDEGVQLRLSLMRSPNWPDPRADRSRRTVRYALLVGADPVAATAAGYELNLPLRELAQAPEVASIVTVSDPRVQVEAVLPAHDGSDDLIVRLYEGSGSAVSTTIELGMSIERIREVSPMEEDLDAPAVDVAVGCATSSTCDLALRSFQIMTLRITPEARS